MKRKIADEVTIHYYKAAGLNAEYYALTKAIAAGLIKMGQKYDRDYLETIISAFTKPSYTQEYQLNFYHNGINLMQLDFDKKRQKEVLNLVTQKAERLKKHGGEVYYTITQIH